MIKYLKFTLVFFLLLFITVIFYGKSKIVSLDMNFYYSNGLYVVQPFENFRDNQKLNSFSNASTLDQLIADSAYVLKVKKVNSCIVGDGIVNQLEVLKVIKGQMELGDIIDVYDLSSVRVQTTSAFDKHTPSASATYYTWNTPINSEDEYFVFLNETDHPAVEGAFIFSSGYYSSFRISDETLVLRKYENYSKTITEIMDYDLVEYWEEDTIVQLEESFDTRYLKYEEIKQELLKRYN